MKNNLHIIEKGGKPAFAVIPYDHYLQLKAFNPDALIPVDVKNMVAKGDSYIKAWRKYFNISQRELAASVCMSASTLCRVENDANPDLGITKRIAAALGVEPELLTG